MHLKAFGVAFLCAAAWACPLSPITRTATTT